MNQEPRASDRLLRRVRQVGAPVCVGLDPVLASLPKAVSRGGQDDAQAARAITDFCLGVLKAVRGVVPAVKVQSACFERHGPSGMNALAEVLHAAQGDFETILDFKRADIGVSADHYAHAAREAFAADWCTINPYLGVDALAPFLARDSSGAWHGAFALVRTSNPSGDQVQSLQLADGRTVGQAVADLVATTGAAHVGEEGYSDLGAVVGATKRADAAELRRRMPQQVILVPGFGAQGGGVDDVLPCFNADGRGALVTASRSVIYAAAADDANWMAAVERAAREFHDAIASGLGMPRAAR